MKGFGLMIKEMVEALSGIQQATATMDHLNKAKHIAKVSIHGSTAKYTMVNGTKVWSKVTGSGVGHKKTHILVNGKNLKHTAMECIYSQTVTDMRASGVKVWSMVMESINLAMGTYMKVSSSKEKLKEQRVNTFGAMARSIRDLSMMVWSTVKVSGEVTATTLPPATTKVTTKTVRKMGMASTDGPQAMSTKENS
jgi:hypothetical protein